MNIMMSRDIFLQVQVEKKEAEKGNPAWDELKPVMRCCVLLCLLSVGLTGARLWIIIEDWCLHDLVAVEANWLVK